MGELSLSLPWPPRVLSPNARESFWAKAKAKKDYRYDCYWTAIEQGAKWARIPEGKRLKARISFYPPNKHHRDQDNQIASIKALIDGVADAVGVDDKHWDMAFEFPSETRGQVVVCLQWK